MKVERIAECSPWSILQYFWPALSDNCFFFFLSGHLRQILLYNQQSIYIYAYKCLCQCVGKVYYPNVKLWLAWYAWAHRFRKWPTIFHSMGHFGPPILKKIWSPDIEFKFILIEIAPQYWQGISLQKFMYLHSLLYSGYELISRSNEVANPHCTCLKKILSWFEIILFVFELCLIHGIG